MNKIQLAGLCLGFYLIFFGVGLTEWGHWGLDAFLRGLAVGVWVGASIWEAKKACV